MRHASIARAVLSGGLLGGSLDLMFAVSLAGYNGAAPAKVFQTIASGMLGNSKPEPHAPDDLQAALMASPAATAAWEITTTIARVDWIHWLDCAQQASTRKLRVDKACDMLASGKKRVCGFDRSGFYSKGLSAPQSAK